MIEIRDINKAFGDRTILSGISGTFEKSKNSLIIGASGTGKSVLLKVMVGLIKPDKGEVLYDGRDLIGSPKTVQREIRREMGMLFQNSALFDSMTVEENVRFPLDILTQMPLSEKMDRVHNCIKRVGLEAAAKKMPSELSGGMRKRVGIARAIVNDPKYLFCDEPNSGLDPQTAILIDELISEITDEFSITTVVVTHDMNSVMGIGEYVMFLFQGLKLWEGTKDTIIEATVPELRDFIFAGSTMQGMRKYTEIQKRIEAGELKMSGNSDAL
jgi:phospholipid/cholesterol/gamma-HCH transport system ATP-binding protein